MPQANIAVERLEEVLVAARQGSGVGGQGSGDGGLMHVELQGEGEPMLHPRFFEMAAMIRRMHPVAKISLITNGSL